jgi:hypothetical protein
MSSNGDIYSYIIDEISIFKPAIIYLAVGCAMGHYSIINPNNNQQYPLFLHPFTNKKKLFILIDPQLENPLKLESQINLTETNSVDYLRVLQNENLIIFAIKKLFYFYHYDKNTLDKIFLNKIISYSIENKIKTFVQDYTGIYIKHTYLEYLEDNSDIKKYVIFDVSEDHSGCFVDFSKVSIYYDSEDNFIQPHFLTLVEIKKLSFDTFKIHLNKRIDWINYRIFRQIRIINKEIDEDIKNTIDVENILKNLKNIYDNITLEITINNLENTINYVVSDIIIALKLDETLLTSIKTNMINELSKLKIKVN